MAAPSSKPKGTNPPSTAKAKAPSGNPVLKMMQGMQPKGTAKSPMPGYKPAGRK